MTALSTLAYIEQHLGEDPLQWQEGIDHLRAGGYTDEATVAVMLRDRCRSS